MTRYYLRSSATFQYRAYDRSRYTAVIGNAISYATRREAEAARAAGEQVVALNVSSLRCLAIA